MEYLNNFYSLLSDYLKASLKIDKIPIYLSRDIYENVIFETERLNGKAFNISGGEKLFYRNIELKINEFYSKTIYFTGPDMYVYLYMDSELHKLEPVEMQVFSSTYLQNLQNLQTVN